MMMMILVMMMMFALAYRHHAPMRHLALRVLKLNRGVVDAETLMQPVFHVPENAFADRRRNVGNCNVARQCASFRADAPDVEIMNVVHAFNGSDRSLNALQLDAARRAFQQNIQSFADDAEVSCRGHMRRLPKNKNQED